MENKQNKSQLNNFRENRTTLLKTSKNTDNKAESGENLPEIDSKNTKIQEINNSADKKDNISLEEKNDFEQRRCNRLSAILGIIAIVGTLAVSCYKLLVSVINVWPSKGFLYIYLQVFMTIIVTSFVIIIISVANFCISDLMRFDILNPDHKINDIKSDTKYSNFIKDSKLCIGVLLGVLFNAFTISFWEKNTIQSFIIGAVIFILILLSIVFCYAVPNIKNKNMNSKYILGFIGRFFIFGLIIYYISFISVTNPKGSLDIYFNDNGIIDIKQESGTDIATLEVKLYNAGNDLIKEITLRKDDFMKAKEAKYIDNFDKKTKSGVSQGTFINSEILYAYAQIDLSNIIDKNGDYYIVIDSVLKNNKLQFINQIKYDGVYKYTKNNLKKEF